MTLKISKAETRQIESIAAVIYGFPNSGKTTLSLSAKNPLLIDFDRGVHRAGNKTGKDVVFIDSWRDVEQITLKDLEPFDTIIIDTIGTCIDYLSLDIIEKDPKCGSGGVLAGFRGYGALKARFAGFINMLRSASSDVIMIAHVKEEMKKDDVVERIVASGSSKDMVYQSADIMGRIFINETKQRVISFNPTMTAYGKNVGLEDYILPAPGEGDESAMEKIVAKAKSLMNESLSEEAVEGQRMEAMIKWIDDQKIDASTFTNARKVLVERGALEPVLGYLSDVARRNGLKFDEATGFFTASNPDIQEAA